MHNMMVFSGNANPELARKVAEHLRLPLGDATGKFTDFPMTKLFKGFNRFAPLMTHLADNQHGALLKLLELGSPLL